MLTLVGANVPRISSAGAILEGQRTNTIRNPHGLGGTVGIIGSGGVMPTNWVASNPGALTGVVTQLVGYAVESNMICTDIRLSAFNPSGSIQYPTFGVANGAAGADAPFFTAGTNTPTTAGMYLRLMAGSMAGVQGGNLSLIVSDHLPDGTQNNGGAGAAQTATSFVPTSAPLITQRYIHTKTALGTATSARVRLAWGVLPGQGYDFTLRVGTSTHEIGSFISEPMYPAAGATGQTTRAVDVLTVPWASVAPRNEATILMSGTLPSANTGGLRTLFSAHDGTSNNRWSLRFNNGDAGIVKVVGGSAASGGSAVLLPGAGAEPFRAGLTIRAGRIAAFGTGGTVQQNIGALPVVTTFQVGARDGGNDALFGIARRVLALPRAVSDAELQRLVNNLPI